MSPVMKRRDVVILVPTGIPLHELRMSLGIQGSDWLKHNKYNR